MNIRDVELWSDCPPGYEGLVIVKKELLTFYRYFLKNGWHIDLGCVGTDPNHALGLCWDGRKNLTWRQFWESAYQTIKGYKVHPELEEYILARLLCGQ